MRFILSESQFKYLLEQSTPVKESVISKLFKILNKEKKKHKKRSDLIEVIRKYMIYFSIPKGLELYLLDLYVLNYRKDGDYSFLDRDNFIDPRKQDGRKIPNQKSHLYTKAQMPFRGSNLQAYWTEDSKGVPYYVVKSYDWYPIYIYKEGIWYEVIDRYSSTTGKQMSRSNPIRWDDDIKEKVYLLTKDEMGLMERYADHEIIMRKKIENLKSSEKKVISDKLNSLSVKPFWNNNQTIPEHKIKYKITSIDMKENKAIINIDIYDVIKSRGGIGLNTPENYLKGELGLVSKESVEDEIKRNLTHTKLKNYIGDRISWNEGLPEDSNIQFNFNHLRK